MANGTEAINALREALKFSPQNVPLLKHLADSLLANDRPSEAEEEYRKAMALAPDDADIKLGLAKTYQAQNKNSHAIVIVEALVKSPACKPEVQLLFAKLSVKAGDLPAAMVAYRKAVAADAKLADPELAEILDVDPATGQQAKASEQSPMDWQAGTGDDDPVDGVVERPKLNFSGVGGMDDLKEEIRMKIIYPITHAEMFKAYGKTAGGGILLYGPPGCGKTYLARATAGEIDAGFLSVGIHDVLEMYIGNSERNLHELFERGRENRPCVLFFDEVDALGGKRAERSSAGIRHLVNSFLAEFDGIQSSNEGLLILGATNAPWDVDHAFRRPGRFDRVLFVPPPDASARASIMKILTAGKPCEALDFAQIAKATDGFSGADLKGVVDVTVERKLQEAMKAGIPKPMSTKDFLAAAKTIKPTTKEWFATARNYALYSNQGGIYDDILKYLKLT